VVVDKIIPSPEAARPSPLMWPPTRARRSGLACRGYTDSPGLAPPFLTVYAVAHSVAHFAAKPAQNAPKRCVALCRKLLICIRWGYYLADFKTAAFSQLGHSSVSNLNLFLELAANLLRSKEDHP